MHVLEDIDTYREPIVQRGSVEIVDEGDKVLASDIRRWVNPSFDASLPPCSFRKFPNILLSQYERNLKNECKRPAG